MKKNLKYLLLIFVLTGIALAVISFGHKKNNGNESEAVSIGIVFPLTGDASSYGQKGRKAIEMAVNSFNTLHARGGSRIAAVFEDSKGSAKDGVSAAQKLISVNQVPAIVGDALSSVTLPVSGVTEKNKVVLMAPCSSAPALTGVGPYTFRIWPSDLAEGKAAAEYAIGGGFKRAAMLHLNNDYGNGIAGIFEKHFVDNGHQVVFKSAYQDTTSDWRTVVTPLVSAGADVIYIAGYYKDTAAILRTAAELGIKAQFIGATAIEDENLIKLAGGAAEGIVYPLATGYDAVSTDPTTKTFVTEFKKRYAYEPGWMEAHAYDAFMLVCEGARSGKGPVTGDQIRNFLDHMGTYHGVTGDIKFDKNGDVIRAIVFKTVKNGKFVRWSKSS